MVSSRYYCRSPANCDFCNKKTKFLYQNTKVAKAKQNAGYDYDVTIIQRCYKCIVKNIFKKKEVTKYGTIN